MIRGDVTAEEASRAWWVLISGAITQQLSNAPEQSFERGRFTQLLPSLTTMFVAHYGLR
jgi:hypothetical protein